MKIKKVKEMVGLIMQAVEKTALRMMGRCTH